MRLHFVGVSVLLIDSLTKLVSRNNQLINCLSFVTILIKKSHVAIWSDPYNQRRLENAIKILLPVKLIYYNIHIKVIQ